MKQLNDVTYISDKGKIFVHINDEDTNLGHIIQIGLIPDTKEPDSIVNYKEVPSIKFESEIETVSSNPVTLTFGVEVQNEMNYVQESEL